MVNTEEKNRRRALELVQSWESQISKMNKDQLGVVYNIIYKVMDEKDMFDDCSLADEEIKKILKKASKYDLENYKKYIDEEVTERDKNQIKEEPVDTTVTVKVEPKQIIDIKKQLENEK